MAALPTESKKKEARKLKEDITPSSLPLD